MKTLKALGILLNYPKQEIINNLAEIELVIEKEKILSYKKTQLIKLFIKEQKKTELITLQENYVAVFDRGKSFCLNLFEHVYGDSRDRGQAMVDLAEMYHEKNLYINSGELPDFLPLFLEYLSLCEVKKAQELLGETAHIIAAIGSKLEKINNSYAIIFKAIQELSTATVSREFIENALAELEKEDNSLEELDRQWEEAAAFSDKADADCNKCNTSQEVKING